MTAVLSIQSSVVYGHVGLGASTLALQRRGIKVWQLPTALLSNHTGYPTVSGRRFSASEVGSLGQGLIELGVLASIDGIASGYLGTAETAEAVVSLTEAARAANPSVIYLCDPVLGDTGRGLFLPEEVGRAYRDRLIPAADIVTPNRFELVWLTGRAVDSLDDCLYAAQELLSLGPANIYITSVASSDDRTGILAVNEHGAWLATVQKVPFEANGSGDLAAALILADCLAGLQPPAIAQRVVATLKSVVEQSRDSSGGELQVVAAQDVFVRPPSDADVQQIA